MNCHTLRLRDSLRQGADETCDELQDPADDGNNTLSTTS